MFVQKITHFYPSPFLAREEASSKICSRIMIAEAAIIAVKESMLSSKRSISIAIKAVTMTAARVAFWEGTLATYQLNAVKGTRFQSSPRLFRGEAVHTSKITERENAGFAANQ